jgi:hypothetical protein
LGTPGRRARSSPRAADESGVHAMPPNRFTPSMARFRAQSLIGTPSRNKAIPENQNIERFASCSLFNCSRARRARRPGRLAAPCPGRARTRSGAVSSATVHRTGSRDQSHSLSFAHKKSCVIAILGFRAGSGRRRANHRGNRDTEKRMRQVGATGADLRVPPFFVSVSLCLCGSLLRRAGNKPVAKNKTKQDLVEIDHCESVKQRG